MKTKNKSVSGPHHFFNLSLKSAMKESSDETWIPHTQGEATIPSNRENYPSKGRHFRGFTSLAIHPSGIIECGFTTMSTGSEVQGVYRVMVGQLPGAEEHIREFVNQVEAAFLKYEKIHGHSPSR